MALQGLLNDGDEVLMPAPDYPLWTAGVSLSGGTPVHYVCDESNRWMPDLDDIRAKITPNTRALVVINPNNPTGALYSDELLLGLIEIARQHGLVIFADEVYDKIVYDGKKHTSMAALSEDVLTVTFNSLSKSYRSCGYRAGWMFISGLTGENRRNAQRLLRRARHSGLDAPVPERARPVRDPDRAGRLSKHQRPDRAERAPVQTARTRV